MSLLLVNMGILFLLYMRIISLIILIIKGRLYRRWQMIVFDRLWETMKLRGITKYALREHYSIDSRTIRRLAMNKTVTTSTLNNLCNILDYKLEDIAEYKPDE